MRDLSEMPNEVCEDDAGGENLPELIRRCCEDNDRLAWSSLLAIAERDLASFYSQIGVGKNDRHDLCQQTLTKVYKGLHGLKKRSSFLSWVRKIGRRTWQDLPKRAGWKEAFWDSFNDPDHEKLADIIASKILPPDARLEQQERELMAQKHKDTLMKCLARLEETDPLGGRVIKLHYVESFTLEKIAKKLKKTVEEIKAVMLRAIDDLKSFFLEALGSRLGSLSKIGWENLET